jgi:hypothetical protein
LDESRKIVQTRPHLKNYPAYSTAWCYARTGDKAGALDQLEKSFQRRERYLPTAKTSPIFDLLRDEPRFQDLLKRIGL